ncbi:MAG: hypothetical protein Q8N73_01980 [bacterium]|nr:hypothetical protein [bacterium]
MKARKVIGWLLLLIGLIIIFYGLFTSYNIFTGKSPGPAVFKMPEKEAVLPQQGKIQSLEGQMEEMIGEQLKGMLPVDFIPKLLNLISWSIMAGILIFAGTQISSLGIRLIKK